MIFYRSPESTLLGQDVIARPGRGLLKREMQSLKRAVTFAACSKTHWIIGGPLQPLPQHASCTGVWAVAGLDWRTADRQGSGPILVFPFQARRCSWEHRVVSATPWLIALEIGSTWRRGEEPLHRTRFMSCPWPSSILCETSEQHNPAHLSRVLSVVVEAAPQKPQSYHSL